MSNAAPRTVEQVVMPLAMLEVPCPNCYRGFHGAEGSEDHPKHPCLTCHGTGQVAEFPMLRELWEEPHTHIQVFDPYANHDRSKSIILDSESPKVVAECEANKRRGWLLVTTEAALREAACSLQTVVIIAWHPTKKIWSVVIGSHKGDTADFKAAMARALCAAKGIEVK